MKKIKQLFCPHIIQIEIKTMHEERIIVSNATIKCVQCDKHFTNLDIRSDYVGSLQFLHMENLCIQETLLEMARKRTDKDGIE